ncbi:ADOP family duplicated permease [Granulicella arctica]|uniref:Putative ABC transport system permease protein n=1 Tax=Granulicella arctica TaxID=940613 RepID=A0A7Y9PFP7_9BACT|nr:putative ABC transport system permease protein [Granulicella arctica]
MKFLRRFFIRFSNLATRQSADQRLQDEIAEHLAFQTEENMRLGMSPAEARRQAALKLGAAQAIRDHHHAEQSIPFIENLLFDLRYAVRMLLRSPGFSLIAIATMALGIGATTAIYSVIDATLLHPLPYPNPAQLVRIEDNLSGVGAQDVGISVPEWRDLESSGIFQSVSISGHGADVNLTGSAQPERLSYKNVSSNYLAVLGVDTQLGRIFDPHDATPGFNLEAVISDGLWRREFGGDPHILGKALLLDNDLYHVVGVLPSGFRDLGSTSEERNTEVWLAAGMAGLPFPPPMRGTRLQSRVVARLQPGLSIAAAQQRLDALVASLKKQYPAEYPAQAAWTMRLSPLSESVVGGVRQSLVLLFGAVGLVLLISCVNVANLLLARASGRGREIAVRQALGAQRTRLIRQLLTEILLLFLLGGVAGFAILFGAQRFLLRLVPESLPHLNNIAVGWGVLVFAIAVSVAAGIIFGLAPAWLMSSVDLMGTLRQEGRGSKGSPGRSRARQILVMSELALSLVLMVAAGLLLRSFWDLFKVSPGFNPDRVMAIQTWLPGPNDPAADIYRTATQESVLLREILRRSRTLPGVEEAAIGDVAALPLGHSRPSQLPLIREGVETIDNQAPRIYSPIVSPEYFHLLGMPLLQGRLFNDQDLEDTPQVVVINQAAARIYWPNQDPLGKRVRLHLDARQMLSSAKPAWTTIIGVIADARTESLADAAIPQLYRSVYQRSAKDLAIFLRGQLDPSTISVQVRQQVQSIDPQLPVFHAETLDDVLSTSLSVRRFSMEMVALFAATALLLAGLGIYGTISYVVNEQRREIAIRLALGAQRANILKMVLRQGLRLVAAGAGVGLVAALIVSHLMAGLLYGVSPTDLPVFAGVTFVLTTVALAASYIPALRAMRLDPITTLHSE